MANNFPTIKPSLNLQLARTGILPPDVTFTRASSSGGYYDGKTVVKAEENLTRHSQEFDNAAWAKNDTTITANTTVAPDGTTTADTLTATAGTAIHRLVGTQVNTAFIGQLLAISIFAKKGTSDFVQLRPAAGGSTMFANFNLNTGAVEVTGAGLTTATSIAVGDFYRFIITFTADSIGNSQLVVNMINSDTAPHSQSFDAAGTETVILWGAQVEQRDAVTAYTPTTTQPITRFQPKLEFAIANEPVFDHNPVTGEALGLSIFEARTNMLQRSQEFDNAYWTKTNSTIEANQIIAPNGTLTADKFIPASSLSAQNLSRNSGGDGAFTFSIFAKKAEFTYLKIRLQSGSVALNLDTGEVTGNNGTFQAQSIGNGWYRLSNVITSITGGWAVQVWGSNSATLVSGFSSEVVTDADGYKGVYIWGAQLEAGAFATPYIPTTTATVTRAAVQAVMTGANFSRFYRADEGSFVVEAFARATPSSSRFALAVSDGTGNNRISMATRQSTTTTGFQVVFGGAVVAGPAITVSADAVYKFAGAYATNSFNAAVAGTLGIEDTAGNVPVVDRMQIGANQANAGATAVNGNIKSIQYYPARLTNDNLVAVTA